MKTPNPANLVKITFQETIPNKSWYRHVSWEADKFKRFRHAHTMTQDVTEFEFFNDKNDTTPPGQ